MSWRLFDTFLNNQSTRKILEGLEFFEPEPKYAKPNDNESKKEDPEPEAYPSSEWSSMFLDLNIPIYQGSTATLLELFVMLCHLMLKGNFTENLLSMLLKMLQIILPQPNNAFKSVYHFNKVLSRQKIGHNLHYYCSACETEVKFCLILIKNSTKKNSINATSAELQKTAQVLCPFLFWIKQEIS